MTASGPEPGPALGPEPGPGLIPPAWFVTNFNREPLALGLPFRTALDPLVMQAWHFATSEPPVRLCIVTGI
jgi:hypothetical protein